MGQYKAGDTVLMKLEDKKIKFEKSQTSKHTRKTKTEEPKEEEIPKAEENV